MRRFKFTWYANDRLKLERNNVIILSRSSKDTETCIRAVIDIFKKSFGNLRKNTITAIQEIDEEGNCIGEPVTRIAEQEEVVTA